MSPEETAPPESTAAEGAPAVKRQGSAFRVVLIFLLVIAVIALVIDLRARASAKALDEKLMGMLQGREKPTIDTVHQEVGRKPDKEYDHKTVRNTKVEEYGFRGALRKYIVYVYYQTKPDVRLDAVSPYLPLTEDQL